MKAWELLKQTATCWSDHEAPRMGAALAYYSVLSMAPLVVLLIAIAGYFYGQNDVQARIVSESNDLLGPVATNVIQDVLKSAHQPSGIIATILGIVTLLVGASGMFIELRTSLNLIWEVPKKRNVNGLTETVQYYFFSFTMVLTIGFLLLVSLILSAFLEVFEHWLTNLLPPLPAGVILFNSAISFVVISLLFAMIYKFVPDAHVDWSDVVHGSIATALLFTAGKALLAIYIGKMSVGSAYGAAGSLVAMLVWVYYSAQIFFFGAEFTHIYARYRHPLRVRAQTSGA